jgi:hypothetical protein
MATVAVRRFDGRSSAHLVQEGRMYAGDSSLPALTAPGMPFAGPFDSFEVGVELPELHRSFGLACRDAFEPTSQSWMAGDGGGWTASLVGCGGPGILIIDD